MSWWGADKPKEQGAQDQTKMLAENTQALAGMEMLAQKINASAAKDEQDAASMERYLQRLRQEGSGR